MPARSGASRGSSSGAGRWELAADKAAQAHDISIQYGLEVPQDHLPIAVVAVHRGQLALAREHSHRALELAEQQFALHPPQHLAVLGLAALWGGDLHEGLAWLGRAGEQASALGWGEPSIRWWTGDHVETFLSLGRVDDAARLLDVWEADAARLGREWVLAHATRCRGLLEGARGIARSGRIAPRAGDREARGGRRSLRTCARPSRARRHSKTRPAEGRSPRRAPGRAPRLRAARRIHLGRDRPITSSGASEGAHTKAG